MGLVYGSVCSGIEAASVAWHPLGWRASFLSEIEAFPRAVLAHHYPETPLHGDFTTIEAGQYEPIDLLVGGTPCQSFSIAGLRGGLDDDRGNLALEYLRLAQRLRPRWLVWENVPGVFSSASHVAPDLCAPNIDLDAGDGPADGEEVVVEDQYDADESHAFSCILAGFSELGYGFAYRVLDAQFLGVAQRRRRVFVVGYLGDWRRAAAVLFERHSLSGHPAPRRGQGPSVAALTANGVGTCGADDNQGQAGHLIASTGDTSHRLNAGGMGRQDYETETLIAHTLKGEGFDASEDGTGRGTPIVPVKAFSIMPMNSGKDFKGRETDIAQPVMAAGPAGGNQGGDYIVHPINPNALRGDSHAKTPSMDAAGVMRLRDPGLGIGDDGDPADTLQAAGPGAIAFALRGREGGAMPEVCEDGSVGTLRAADGGSSRDYVAFADPVPPLMARSSRGGAQTLSPGHQTDGHMVGAGSAVRRLTPRECERLQGFPDDYTAIQMRGKPAADGPRYKALGNSMAVPVMAWIGQRIAAVDAITLQQRAAA